MPKRSDAEEITKLLEAHAAGDEDALARLIPLVYEDLRQIARQRRRSEWRSHPLNTTAIVHEAYIRLVGVSDPAWTGRAHFLAVSSRIIRNLLIDHARRSKAEKRGGDVIRISLDESLDAGSEAGPPIVDVLALDDALTDLAQHDERLETIVEYRFFGGLTVPETAQVLGVSVRTVERDWTRAKAYLYRALNSG